MKFCTHCHKFRHVWAVFITTARRFIDGIHVWSKTSTPQSNNFHTSTIARTRNIVSENPLPGRIFKVGLTIQLQRRNEYWIFIPRFFNDFFLSREEVALRISLSEARVQVILKLFHIHYDISITERKDNKVIPIEKKKQYQRFYSECAVIIMTEYTGNETKH